MSDKLNIKVKPIGLLDLLAFKKLVPKRIKKIETAQTTSIKVRGINVLANKIHPSKQDMIIKDIINHNEKVKSYVLAMKNGDNPAYFRAGQYISFNLRIGNSLFTRPYSLSSSPNDALKGFYSITIKESNDGFFSIWALKNWKIGDEIEVSAPEGNFYYQPMRDATTVVGICGGSGVTPFLSLAKAISEGVENFNLVLFYGSCKEKDILFKERFDDIQKNCKKVKVIHVLSDENKEGYENGFITAELIKKYAPNHEKHSVFICGPQAMYNFLDKQLKALKIDNKYIRRELFGEVKCIDEITGYPQKVKEEYKLIVNTDKQSIEINAKSNESLLVAMEKAGIAVPSRCRSGECGYCRSRLISGKVFVPKDSDGRRAADKKFGFVHPCSSYPLSDITIELPN